jgi:hypothetical protein
MVTKFRWGLRTFCCGMCLCVLSYPASASDADKAAPGAPDPPASAQGAIVPPASEGSAQIAIPGPLRSFLRMAAISQKVSPDEVVPFLAHNVFVTGYRRGQPTEYLTLLRNYVKQAKQLTVLAGPQGVLRAANCKEAQSLLTVLGYELKGACGPRVSVESADADTAFLTVDSGFPLADLEEALRSDKPFAYAYSAQVPLLFTQADWAPVASPSTEAFPPNVDLIDALLSNPELARLYWALARMDPETRDSLRRSPGLPKLLPLVSVLDFYGAHITVRSGRVVVPGGKAAEPAWKELVGASPDSPGEFVTRLLAKDGGWLAAYYDALSRVNESRQSYFASPQRLVRDYAAVRGGSVAPGPAEGVFRLDSNLLLLVTRVQFEASGQPHIPGGLESWKEVLGRGRNDGSRIWADWGRRASRWTSADQLMEGMFGLSRVGSQNGPVQLFLALTEMDRRRPADQRLSSATARLLGENFSRFGNQYMLFAEFSGLNNAAITRFLVVAQSTDHIKDRILRADTLGILQANIGLWQILARQGQIASGNLSDSLEHVIGPFAAIRSADQLFGAGRTSLQELVQAATGNAGLSEGGIIAVLAGPNQSSTEGQEVRQAIASRMQGVMADQRLVSLDTLLSLGDALNQKSQDVGNKDELIQQAGELRAFEMPRPLFTTRERAAWASRFFYNRHAQAEMQTDVAKIIQSNSAGDFPRARGELAPFLRDTLVGLNYAYYEPPGAQLLHNNPLFVRFHDFSGGLTGSMDQPWQTPILVGRGDTPSGGAHFEGSLANLPYALATVEQGMFVPENVQSLIWQDLVPDLLASAILPRWWGIDRNELHAVTLYQATGEEILGAASQDERLRPVVINILSNRMLPETLESVEESLRAGRSKDAVAETTPAETLYLTVEFRRRFPSDTGHWGAAGNELQELVSRFPEEASWQRLSEDFGVPHPALTQNYARELLDVKPFPSFMIYASRLLAESWDSTSLYWARLADERGYPPVMLNLLVPELTRRMIGKISATHSEDWPAVLRAMRETGEEFREGKISPLPQLRAEGGN